MNALSISFARFSIASAALRVLLLAVVYDIAIQGGWLMTTEVIYPRSPSTPKCIDSGDVSTK